MADSKHVKASIQALGEELALMPEVGDEERVISTREAVRLLLPMIQKMQRKGYPLERIVERLAAGGVTVTKGTLRGYLRGGRKKKVAGGGSPAAAAAAPPSAGGGGSGATPSAGAAPADGRSRGAGEAPSAPAARPDSRRASNGESPPGATATRS